jgi:hypothetical protein
MRYGSFEFQVMPFGLTNAPNVFSGYHKQFFSASEFVMENIDDILIDSRAENEHLRHVRLVI